MGCDELKSNIRRRVEKPQADPSALPKPRVIAVRGDTTYYEIPITDANRDAAMAMMSGGAWTPPPAEDDDELTPKQQRAENVRAALANNGSDAARRAQDRDEDERERSVARMNAARQRPENG
jgi:hypothetical protein